MEALIDVLLIGGAGQVGSELRRLCPPGWRISAPGRAELDVADAQAVGSSIAARRWDMVVNAAGYTNVDRAETEADMAWSANAQGPAILAEAAARAGVPLIHLSTDYVFDGGKPTPYVEDDAIGPLGVYGASKAAGEAAVRAAAPRHVILRTAWLVSPHGRNFAKTMLRLAADGRPVRVVDDQRGCPTSAADVASALAKIVERLIGDPEAPTGTYHFANEGEASWCEFARAIFARSAARGGPAAPVEAIGAADYPTPARRPANSRLATAKLQRDFGISPRPWRTAVEDVVDLLLTTPG